MHEDPLVQRWDVSYYRHAGAGEVLVVGYVVYDGAPGFEVGGGLVGEFLAVQRVALV